MKPLEAFLCELHPEVMTVGKKFILGEEYEFRNPDRAALRKLVKEHYATGQDVLSNFRAWLVRHEGRREDDAAGIAAVVWNALCMTYDVAKQEADPTKLLDRKDETYTYSAKMRITHGLRFWARYKNDSKLYEATMLWMRRKPDEAPKFVLEALNESPPYTAEEYRELLKALEGLKGSPRYPWAWSCLRLIFVCGISIVEVTQLEKGRIHQALKVGHMSVRAALGKYFRVVSIEPVREELKALLAFPWEWGIVADLTNPARTIKINSRKDFSSTSPLRHAAELVFKHAGVVQTNNWPARVRWSAAWQYYKRTENLVGAAQIIGVRDLLRVSKFIEELKKREAPVVESVENDS